MTKIKYIHCFGTSYTAGGGFEFDSVNENRNELLKSIYSESNEIFSQFNFSWPGQLQKLLDKDIQVINHAKNGYGNDRMVRVCYNLINDKNFNPKENLFILEFAGFGRDEFFFNEIEDYIVCNYQMKPPFENKINFNFVGAANSYGYDSVETQKKIDNYDKFFHTYVDKFVNFEKNELKLKIQSELFLSFLEKKNINFLFSICPILDYEYDVSNHIEFGYELDFKKSNNFVSFINDNKLTITDETNNRIQDGHGGLLANKLVAKYVYKKILDSNYLNNSGHQTKKII